MTARRLLVLVAIACGALLVPGSTPVVAADDALGLEWTTPVEGRVDALLADARGVVEVSDRGEVSAIAPSGEEQWTARVADQGESTYFVTPSLGAGVVAIPVDRQRVVALDRDTGDQLWSRPVPTIERTASGVASDGSGVVATADDQGRLDAFDAASGAPRWTTSLAPVDSDNSAPRLWFRDGMLVVQWLTIDDLVRFHVYDGASGSLQWERGIEGISTIASVTRSAIAFAEFYAIDDTREGAAVRSLDLRTGTETWTHELPAVAPYVPTLTGAARAGVVTVVDMAGTFHAFDASDGRLRWRRATGDRQVEGALRIAGEVVAMSTHGTGLLAFRTTTGTPVATQPIGRLQLDVTIEESAAAGDRLYLLVTRNGESVESNGEVWSFRAPR